MTRKLPNQHGFTILELLIATMVFSVIFLATTTALVQIGKLYYKGVVSSRTQELARGLTDQLSQQMQFGTDLPTPATPLTTTVAGGNDPTTNKLTFQAICVDTTRYSYRLNTQVNSSVTAGTYDKNNNRLQHALWRDSVPVGSCAPLDLSQTTPSANGEELLGQNMRLNQFDLKCNNQNSCTVSIGILYGDNDLLTPNPTAVAPNQIPNIHCDTIIGNQWCASSQFSTTVFKRVGLN